MTTRIDSRNAAQHGFPFAFRTEATVTCGVCGKSDELPPYASGQHVRYSPPQETTHAHKAGYRSFLLESWDPVEYAAWSGMACVSCTDAIRKTMLRLRGDK